MKDQLIFASKAELFKYLKDNQDKLIADKMCEVKCADAISYSTYSVIVDKQSANKTAENIQLLLSKDVINVEVVINTTKLLDSHRDVHIDGLWTESLKKKNLLYHLQEHKKDFDKVISDNVQASTKQIAWQDLGFNFEGKTEALVFASEIEKARNAFMFEQYARGYVKNHSVGMRYMQIYMCINSEEKYYATEKQNWDKYIEYVVNKDEADKYGYFWAVTEAEVVEGSAVLFGSNYATPTQSVKIVEAQDTQDKGDDGQSPSMFGKFNQLN